MKSYDSSQLFSKLPAASQSPSRTRINPWQMFIGSMIPNWLLRRPEVSHGAKLAYGRLAQYAGKDGDCFPKQKTLGGELAVSGRTASDYIKELVGFGLIEKERPGLGLSNRYFFLDHPWMLEGESEKRPNFRQQQKLSSAPDLQNCSHPEQNETSTPSTKENHQEEIQLKRDYPHSPPKGDGLKESSFDSISEEQIYAAYPRKVGKPTALRAIRRALRQHSFDFLLARTQLFAQTCNSPAEFIPHPATWFNQERFNDDPSTWQRAAGPSGKPQPAIIRPEKFGCGPSKL